MEKIMAACGNDCAACPRYNVPPYEKTEEQLCHTAELWFRIGYRDHIMSADEISCYGCSPQNWCRYRTVKCCQEKEIAHCGKCGAYPCGNLRDCFAVTESFIPNAQKACTEEEFEQLRKAFFEKEKNLETARHEKGQTV